MDKVTAIRRRLSREQWKAIITKCRSSGMTTTAWCKANNICEQTYYKHLKQLKCYTNVVTVPLKQKSKHRFRKYIIRTMELTAIGV